MPDTVTLVLPVPGTIRAVKRRTRDREPEHLAVVHEIPVPVAAVPSREAPVAVSLPAPQGPHGRVWRRHGDALYRPLFSPEDGCTPGRASEVLLNRMQLHFRKGDPCPYRSEGESVLPARAGFGGAQLHRGLRTVAGHQVSDILDDGLAEASAAAARAAAPLLLVDGLLWHAAPPPGILLTEGHRPWEPGSYGEGRLAAYTPYADDENAFARMARRDKGEALPWMLFRPDEAEAATEFAAILYDRPWHGRGDLVPGTPSFVVADPSLLDGVYHDGPALLAASARRIVTGGGDPQEPMADGLAGRADRLEAAGYRAEAYALRCLGLRWSAFLAPDRAAVRTALRDEMEARFAGL